jgi:hypothetical protein
MKKACNLALCAAVLACAVAISCATTKPATEPTPAAAPAPAPAPTTQASAPVEKADTTALDAARAKASDLRKKAFDLGLKDVLPEDYAAADKAFAAGGDKYGKDNAASAASFADAAKGFQGVLDRGLPLLAASERKKAEEQRAAAIAKKAGDRFPELISRADSDFQKPKASEAAADYENAIQGYRASTRAYAVLYKLCEANAVRAYISAHDLAKWDSSNWNLAETKYKASQDQFAADPKSSFDSADEAVLRYGVARDNGLSYYAADRKKASETERDHASSIKSEVAVKDEFASALALYAKAESSQANKDYESSSSLYDKSAKAFETAYAHAKAKMDMAKGELDSLDAAIATKNANAQ